MNAPRVLVIDDDADMRVLMTALLQHLGADVREASNAAETALALQASLDWVLLDLVMPGDEHERCVAALVASGQNMPVSLLSGSTQGQLDLERARLDRMGLVTANCLTKPTRLDTLAATLASLPKRQDS